MVAAAKTERNFRKLVLQTIVDQQNMGRFAEGRFRLVFGAAWRRQLNDDSGQTAGEQISTFILSQAVAAGVLDERTAEAVYAAAVDDVDMPQGINWEAIGQFIITILPVILAFIQALIPLFIMLAGL